ALKTNSATISNVFYGKTSNEWVFNAILPIFPKGQAPRLLILTRNAEDLSSTLSEQNLRGGWNATIVDAEGVVISSSFLSSDIGKPFFLWPLQKGWQTATGRVSNQSPSEPYEAIVSESGYSGWKVVIWAPTSM